MKLSSLAGLTPEFLHVVGGRWVVSFATARSALLLSASNAA